MIILSDLHLEFFPFNVDFPLPQLTKGPTILAGDIFTTNLLMNSSFRIKLAAWMKSLPQPVFFVAGNHEFYNCEYNQALELLTIFLKNEEVIFLHNSCTVHEGVTYHGTTLWTDVPVVAPHFLMNDYKFIKFEDRRLLPADTSVLHQDSIYYLKNSVKKGDVIISHHAPSSISIIPKFKTHPATCFFFSNLETLIFKLKPSVWVHGHVHNSVDCYLYGTRIIANPHGYLSYDLIPENQDFDLNKFVQIDL